MVLLVNEGEETRTAFASALDHRHLQHAPSIEAAGRYLTDADPDLVVANETLPDGSVRELLQAVRTSGCTEHPPLVALTDGPIEGDVTDLAFDGYLRKPVTSSRVEAFLSRLELVGEYEAAVEDLFHLCQGQARVEHGSPAAQSAELAAAKREADERLDELQRDCEGSVFEMLFDGSA